ncbi:MAG: FAD-dependent oxidoreductase [Elusimicrobia bacterium]|nr:FAD-dependent oxidoreductase [Elusimicrobiota bacterium]
MPKDHQFFLTDAQLCSEIERCEYCEEKPCKEACPADCSPADFIMAAKIGEKGDYKRAAALILGNNPLGGVCGVVCPDKFCMKACVRQDFDGPINIPAVQSTVIQKAKELGVMPEFEKSKSNGKKIAVIGAGPAGWGAAAVLAQKGYVVHIYEGGKKAGGACNLIPDFRLDKEVLKTDLDFIETLGNVSVYYRKKIVEPESLLRKGYRAVLVTIGLNVPITLGISGEENAVVGADYLADPKRHSMKGKRVAIVGGGAVAADCAVTAAIQGAKHIELFALEKLGEMPLTSKEMVSVKESGVCVTGRTKVQAIFKNGKGIVLRTLKVALPDGVAFHPRKVKDVAGSDQTRAGFDSVMIAIGGRPGMKLDGHRRVFSAGDFQNGPTSVVEAVAAGKNAAFQIDAVLSGKKATSIDSKGNYSGSLSCRHSGESRNPGLQSAIKELDTGFRRCDECRETWVVTSKVKSRVILDGRRMLPVPLETDFFGRKIISPFLLSAAPPSDGYEQMKKAYEAGWAGGVMKTCFDNVPIHIPSEYMFAFSKLTYANCDNVSGHPLNRVSREIGRLRREYPDRLTMASTGGPVTGNDESDSKVWQSNTRKLENAGVMGIEYSLSCPQGGDGTKGDIVSQDAELTAKIIDWVMRSGDGRVPKLFKLTAAVTVIYPIIAAIKEVFAKYPNKKAGVTLANTFPTLAFRKGKKKSWEEGIVVGMSGEGVLPISNFTLARVSSLGVTVSGNGGPMDYKAAADFLALGAETVQFCTIVMKYGYGIIADLHSGLSYLMQERGMRSVRELMGCALPNPVTGFMELSSVKKISAVHEDICRHCGNCTRCPYQAVTLDKNKVPVTDASKCIGCSICTQKCFSGALYMRARTKKEAAILQEK